MAFVKTKPLSDVAASHDLKAAYEAIMAFNSSNLAPINISTDFLDRQAEREATMDPLQGGDRGFTAGMKSILCHAAAEPLAKWLRLRSTFDAAIQPFKEKIEAVQNLEDNKRAVDVDSWLGFNRLSITGLTGTFRCTEERCKLDGATTSNLLMENSPSENLLLTGKRNQLSGELGLKGQTIFPLTAIQSQ